MRARPDAIVILIKSDRTSGLLHHLVQETVSGVSGMTHSQPVKVRSQVFTAKCSEPQVESREAGTEAVV
jgi:hypothetical protein